MSRVTLKSDLGRIAREMEPKAAIVVAKVAIDIEGGATIRTPPKVDTGDLMGSWKASPEGDLEWVVGSGVEYAPHVEYGTVHPPRAITGGRNGDGGDVSEEYTIAAHPMLIPAAEEQREPFTMAMRQVLK